MIRSQLAVLILIFVVTGEAMAISQEVISTGIPATLGHQSCWFDDTRLIILQKTQPPHGEPEIEGLYVLDVTKPRELTRIDLAPLSPTMQREIIRLSCQEQTIIFSRSLPGRQISEFYTMTLGRPPERLAELRGAPVSLRGRYLLGSSEKVIQDGGGPLQGTFEGNDDCDVRYVRPGFRVLCWDSFLYRNWPLTRFVLSEYQWRESIKVRAEDGRPKHIPNPAKPLIGKNDQPVNYGLYLRDLTGQIVTSLAEDPKFQSRMYGASITADEEYLYAPCREHTRRTDETITVCRYRLDGNPNDWEEVFRLDARFKYGISMISTSNRGDVYFTGATPYANIWRFEVTARKLNN